METFLQLKQAAAQSLKQPKNDEYKIAIMGDCATQHLATAIRGKFYSENLAASVFDLDYNQIMVQIIDENSELYQIAPNAVLIQMCTEKLYERFCSTSQTERDKFAENETAAVCQYWNLIANNIKTTILHFNYPEIDDKVYGNLAAMNSYSFVFQLRKLNYLLGNSAQACNNVHIVDLCGIQSYVGRNFFYNEKMYLIAKMSVATDALPYVADSIYKLVCALQGKAKKCAILDLDNTLWGGVIGDDGMCGIQVGELGQGLAFSQLQQWLLELKKRGVILAVCSKNDENIAKEPFLHHSEMLLKLEDIAVFVANWENKDRNIIKICETLNIGQDSIVFIDDNPFERNLVKQSLPLITVPDLPEDPANYVTYLRELNLFETAGVTQEDANRTKQYQIEAQRKLQQEQFTSFEDYLKSLKMISKAEPFDSYHFGRIAQLTQRSNQFNLRTVRYTDADIERIANDDKYITRYYTLADKFGDHGLISVIIMEKQDGEKLFIDTWLMSCRVLKRTVEEFIISDIVKAAEKYGYSQIIGEYLPTIKNNMVAHIYESFGFKQSEANPQQFILNTAEYSPKNNYIEIEK